MRSLTVACPAFNEEDALETVVRECIEQVPSFADDFEILLVDDGSTDRTAEIMDSLARRDPRIRVIHHPYNLGFRGIAQTLPKNARKEWYVGISADGEIDLSDVGRMLDRADEGHDIVVGVRRDKPNYNRYRRFVSWGYRTSVRWLLGAELHDPGSTKLFRTSILREIDVVSRSAFMNAERLVKAGRAGYSIGFVDIRQRVRLGGKPKGASARWVAGSLLDLGRVAWDIHTRSR